MPSISKLRHVPDLRVLTNIPNPYNGALYESLDGLGCETEVLYKTRAAREGRTWDVDLRPYERISSQRGDLRALLRQPTEHTLLSGGYHRRRDLVRVACAGASDTNLIFWGERLRNDRAGCLAPVRRALLRPFSSILAIGSWARESYERVSCGRVPIHVFPYGLPGSTVPPARDEEPVLGYAGALIQRKGVGDLLRAAAATQGHPPRLEIVGAGPLRPELEQLGRSLCLRITWFGEMSKDRLDALRSRWWAQVVPSHYDGWGMVVPEALVAGVPVIATDAVGAARDLVLPGITGELVQSPGGLAQAISGLLEPAYQQHLGGAAQLLGAELVAERAAPWLLALLRDRPRTCRSFLDDALACARVSGLPRVGTS